MGIMAMLMKAPAAAPAGLDAIILAEPALTHFYKCNESSGTTAADSKGSANGTVGSGVTVGATALLSDGETAFAFANGNSGVSFSPWANGTAYSVEFWFNPSVITSANDMTLLSNGVRLTNGFHVKIVSGGTALSVTNGTNFVQLSSPSIAASTLYHFVMTNDGSNGGASTVIYLNGTQNSTAGLGAGVTATSAAYLGRRPDGTNTYQGSIEKVAIYSGALSSSAVAAHWAAR